MYRGRICSHANVTFFPFFERNANASVDLLVLVFCFVNAYPEIHSWGS